MNKNVQNYLNNKETKNTELDSDLVPAVQHLENLVERVESGDTKAIAKARKWLQEKGEALKEKLQGNPSKLAQKVLKLILTLTLVVSMTASMTGCDNILGYKSIIEKDPNYSGPTEIIDLENRPIEEIENSKITADDVLAYYDDIITMIARGKYGSSPFKENYNVDETKLYAQFDSITPTLFSEKPIDYYYKVPFCSLRHPWFKDPNSNYFKGPSVQAQNVYNICFNGYMEYDGRYGNFQYDSISIDENYIIPLFEAYNIQPFTMTSEIANSTEYSMLSKTLIGQDVYNSFVLDRNIIKNSNEEQLWALYNMLKSIESINFQGQNLNDIQYEIE